MNSLTTGIAVSLAVVVVLGFFLFGIVNPFGSQAEEQGQPVVQNEVPGAPETTNSIKELMVTDTVVGTGAEAQAGNTVTMKYVGMLENGTIFDASEKHGQDFTFTLGVGQVIAGWDEGIVGMKVGGKRHLVIPADKAYGDRAVGNVIPANSTLIFDVELVSVQ